MKIGKIHIGTSGWKYKHWSGVFYPKKLKGKDQLCYYYSIFDTVELNHSFYKQPTEANITSWKNSVPDDFVFSIKANRYFTHLKKLRISSREIEESLKLASGMKGQLGPILFQLPPRWKINTERLAFFLGLLPSKFRYAFEFRNSTWYHPEIYDLLARHNAAFCIYELGGHISPSITTANFVYIRLHGPGDKYQGNYNEESLKLWSEFVKHNSLKNRDVYLYFDNDEKGYAAFNAQRLLGMVKS